MAVRTGDAAPVEGGLSDSLFLDVDFERPVEASANQMIIGANDMPPKWMVKQDAQNKGPKYGHSDYAARHYCAIAEGKQKAEISFELIMFRSSAMARDLLESTIRNMAFLPMTRLDVGWVGVMINSPGKAGKTSKALMFVERNVVCLILVSHDSDYVLSNHWLVSMARLQLSRIK